MMRCSKAKRSYGVLCLGVLSLIGANCLAEATQPTVAQPTYQNGPNGWKGKGTSASAEKGFTIDAAFLYWQAKEDGLEYATTLQLALPIVGEIDVQGTPSPFEFSWNPGVRVDIGYIFPQREQWELAAGWTYMRGSAHGSASTGDGFEKFLQPRWIPFLMGSKSDQASAHWTLRMNLLDVSLGRNYFVGRWLALRPTVGVRAAWIDQDYHAHYHSTDTLQGGAVAFFNSSFSIDQDFTGAGLRFGTDLKWFITAHWAILGSCAGSILWGHNSTKQNISGAFPGGSTLFPENIMFRDQFGQISPNFDGRLGLEWETFFSRDRFRVSVAAFYDISYWFNQSRTMNESVVFDAIGNTYSNYDHIENDLQFQGGSVELRFEF